MFDLSNNVERSGMGFLVEELCRSETYVSYFCLINYCLHVCSPVLSFLVVVSKLVIV